MAPKSRQVDQFRKGDSQNLKAVAVLADMGKACLDSTVDWRDIL